MKHPCEILLANRNSWTEKRETCLSDRWYFDRDGNNGGKKTAVEGDEEGDGIVGSVHQCYPISRFQTLATSMT